MALDGFSPLVGYTRLVSQHIRPLRRAGKLAQKIAWALMPSGLLAWLSFTLGSPPTYSDPDFRLVERVIDGDTILMRNGERVRLVGVDTPETKHPKTPVEHYGKEAAAFTGRWWKESGFGLQFDFSQGQRDRYGRTLAYVFLQDDTLLNAELQAGLWLRLHPISLCTNEEFRLLDREAKDGGAETVGVQLDRVKLEL